MTDSDIESLLGLLLENETPLTTAQLSRALVERRLQEEAQALQDRFKDVRIYDPAQSYSPDQRLMFPQYQRALGTVKGVREGNGADTAFQVASIEFDDTPGVTREFAIAYPLPHKLNAEEGGVAFSMTGETTLTVDQVMDEAGTEINAQLEERLQQEPDLVSLAGAWFPTSLMLDVNVGHLNLAEAILDMAEGGPMTTQEIIETIGGVGDAPMALQVFSLNYAMNEDPRFDEVGPVDTVLWYLKRLEPQEVITTPPLLKYTPISYDSTLLSREQENLEAEIDDEWSELDEPALESESVNITLSYPHRRVGTLPLNAKMRRVFPTARKTPRVFVQLVDGQDGEEFPGWVVRSERYVFGLNRLYRKHKLPIGATITVRPHETRGKIVVDFNAHNPRKEFVRLIVPREGQIAFEDQKRTIGAEYDDLMILGADDVAAVDALHSTSPSGIRKPLQTVIKMIVAELSRHSAQGAVHEKTIYSAVNVVRRCPPGPIFAALSSSPDFETLGNHYWRLSAE